MKGRHSCRCCPCGMELEHQLCRVDVGRAGDAHGLEVMKVVLQNANIYLQSTRTPELLPNRKLRTATIAQFAQFAQSQSQPKPKHTRTTTLPQFPKPDSSNTARTRCLPQASENQRSATPNDTIRNTTGALPYELSKTRQQETASKLLLCQECKDLLPAMLPDTLNHVKRRLR